MRRYLVAGYAIAFVAALIAVMVWAYRLGNGAADVQPKALPATPAPAIKRVPTVEVQTKVVHALAPAAKRKLPLPDAVIDQPSIYALTANRVPTDVRPHTLITTLDIESGDVQTWDVPEPQPWIAPEIQGELGISYGLRDGMPVGRISLRQNVLQIKSVRIGAAASLDTDGVWFAGIGAFYRW